MAMNSSTNPERDDICPWGEIRIEHHLKKFQDTSISNSLDAE